MVPIENSSIGPVLETMECLRTTTIPTRHMVGLKIGHALLGSKRIQLDQVQRVYSHEQVNPHFFFGSHPFFLLSNANVSSHLLAGNWTMRRIYCKVLPIRRDCTVQFDCESSTIGRRRCERAGHLLDQMCRSVRTRCDRYVHTGRRRMYVARFDRVSQENGCMS